MPGTGGSRTTDAGDKSRETLTNPVKVAELTDAATKNLVLDQDLSFAEPRDLAFSLRNIKGSAGTRPAGSHRRLTPRA